MAHNQFAFIFSYLKRESINIDLQEFAFQVETHPDFPSLYAFSDTLNFFKIENLVAKMEQEDIDYLPSRFVALLQLEGQAPFLSFVEKTNVGYVYTKDRTAQSTKKDGFLSIWKEVVLVVEKTEATLTSKPKNKTGIWALGSITVLALFFIIGINTHFSWQIMGLSVLSCFGLYLSIEAIKQSLGVNSTFADAVCSSTNLQSSNCKTIISSKKAATIYGLELSDLSVIFFSGHIISILIMVIAGFTEILFNYSLLFLGFSIPVILYSIYYQWHVEKKWCAICLMIIGVLLMELVLVALSGFPPNALNLIIVASFAFGFIISFAGWIILKPYLKKYFDFKSSEISLLRFKRNYSLFKLSLKNSKTYNYSTLKSPIAVGNPDAQLKMSIVTNPFCGHCTKVHQLLEEILDKHAEDVQINFRFNLDVEKADNDSKALHFRLLQLYIEHGSDQFMAVLGNWFKNKDKKAWFERYGKSNTNTKIEQLLSQQYHQNITNKLLFTPAIIIGEHLYPEAYDREDIKHFIGELMDDEEFMPKQNADEQQEILFS